jgi:hypothetical protein
VDQHPFPGRAGGGDVPRPGGPAWDGTSGGLGDQVPDGPARDGAAGGPGDDWDGDAEMAAFLADIDAGRARIPEPWEIEGPAAAISLGDACDVDLTELAAMTGPDGLGGDRFAQGNTADVLRPGPVLAALTEQATREIAILTDTQLLGVVSAARRLAARAEYLELSAIAEFTRRRAAQYEASKARKDPRGCREGEFADAELAMELVTSINAARDRMDLAADLATRLPDTFTGLAAGRIDGDRAWTIWVRTRFLRDDLAAQADKVLAAAAPGLRHDQLARKAAALEMKLDPDGVKNRKEDARKDEQRVETRREHSGNATLAGRELALTDVMASKAHIDSLAAALRAGGLAGSLRQLRVMVYLDLTQGRDPVQRLTPAGAQPPAAPQTGQGAADSNQDEGKRDGGQGNGGSSESDGTGTDSRNDRDDDGEEDEDGDSGGEGGDGGGGPKGPGTPAGGLAPFPALVNLIVPAGAVFGWSAVPGDAGAWGLLDGDDTRAIVRAASMHLRTRWCVTLTGPDGTAAAHGCARGRHPWIPGAITSLPGPREGIGGGRDGPAGPQPPTGPDADQAAQLIELLRRLNVTLAPIAKGSCDHRHREDRYIPSRKLKHLIRARTTRCTAPGCGAQAYFCDQDHVIPYPYGPTDECNLHPPCRRHHRCKQAPGWQLTQPQPGIMRWATPSGRIYTTTPTVYDT